MTGTPIPRSRSRVTISAPAAAAASVLTVTRTSSGPACASCATWSAVALASAVSVFVIDWTTIGWADPTSTPPTSTDTVERRLGRRESVAAVMALRVARAALRAARQDPDDVEAADPDQEGEQEDKPHHVGQLLGAEADPRPEDPLQDDHQHPSTIERRERQDVDEGEVRRQDRGHVQG